VPVHSAGTQRVRACTWYTYKLLELLVPALDTTASEVTSLGLEVNWQKTKVQVCAAGRTYHQQSEI